MRIAVAGRKGGVGKTTIACGLASVLSRDKKVLVIDLDPQSNAAFVMGGDPTAPGTAELMMGNSPVPESVNKNLYVLPGGPELSGYKIQSMDPQELDEAIKSLDFDVIIFDCPPGVESLERFGIVAAKVALVCTDAHPLAIMGAGRVINELEQRKVRVRMGARRWALCLSKIDTRRGLDKSLSVQLTKLHPEVPQLTIHQDAALSWAGATNTPLMDYDPHCKGAVDLLNIAEWIFNG